MSVAIALVLVLGLLIDRWPFDVDRAIVQGLRAWGGPGWLRETAIDVTALGSTPILTIVVVVTAGFLLIQRHWLAALATAVSCWSVGWAIGLLKVYANRPRPMLVPHLVEVTGLSFPSGHAAGSAAVYLTVTALATQVTANPQVRQYSLGAAILLVGAIGLSRVYLGVHWPSDVLAGWSFGTLWALGWWIATAGARRSLGR